MISLARVRERYWSESEREVGMGEDFLQVLRRIEARRLNPDFWERSMQSMQEMVTRRLNGEEELILGSMHASEVTDTVTSLMLLPIQPNTMFENVTHNGPDMMPSQESRRIRARDLLVGTPVLAAIKDPQLHKILKTQGESAARPYFEAGVQAKADKVRDGKVLSVVNWGGWGDMMTVRQGRAEALLHARGRCGLPYELVFMPSLFGAMGTHMPDIFSVNKQDLMAKVRLGHIPGQVESMLFELDKWLGGYEPDVLAGHSMGGYVALCFARPKTGLEIIERLKKKNTQIVGDKPVLVGGDNDNMPPWMREVVDSPEYVAHVPLLEGKAGFMIEAGLAPVFTQGPLSGVRRQIVEKDRYVVGPLFRDLIDPEQIFDGHNTLQGHTLSYSRYPDFHRLATQLLKNADPVMGNPTQRLGAQMGVPYLKMVFGGGDRILTHSIGARLAGQLVMNENQIHFEDQAVHLANWREIAWMFDIQQ